MPATDPAREGFWLYLISFLGSPSSELFLTLSGTVLLPIKTGPRAFYKRRFAKLIPPLLIWSVLGLLISYVAGINEWAVIIERFVHIPLQPAIAVYWFVYVMAGLYLLAPFITPWLQSASRRQLEFFLLLWIVNFLLPWITYFFPDFYPNFLYDGNYRWTLCYFGGFLGYWLLGYYLNRYPIRIGWNAKWVTLLTLAAIYPLVILFEKLKGANAVILHDNLQIGSAVLVALLYTVAQHLRVPARLQHLLSDIAKYSYGIYLTHAYIATVLLFRLFDGSPIHTFPRTILIAVITLVGGYLLTRLLGRLPKSKWIIGV